MSFLAIAVPAAAQEAARTRAAAVKLGFAAPSADMQILLFEPEISVSEQTAGGLAVPNADWTEQGRKNLQSALSSALAARGATLHPLPALARADEPLMKDYRSLFRAIAGAAFAHKLFPGDMLPTKANRFDWTLGSGAAGLKRLGAGDYGLFIYSSDVYDSRERKAVEVVAGLLGQKEERGIHMGYAGLVDLATGDLVWISANVRLAGDIRTADGAAHRATQLLHAFPKAAVLLENGNGG